MCVLLLIQLLRILPLLGFLDFSEISQRGIDLLECQINLLADLGSSEYNLPADEYQQDDLRLHHAVDKTREQFRLI